MEERHYSIGVFGSAGREGPEAVAMAGRLGRALAAEGCVVVTGACSGLPYEGARAAAAMGARVIGFSPVRNIEEQRRFVPEDDLSIYAELRYVPDAFPYASDLTVSKKYRNILSTAWCDAGIIIGGKWGTLNEFTNLVDFGKVAGVLSGSGGIAGALPELIERTGIEGEARAIIHDDPEELVRLVLAELRRRGPGSA